MTTIAEAWGNFERGILDPIHAPPHLRIAMKRAYYSGVYYAISEQQSWHGLETDAVMFNHHMMCLELEQFIAEDAELKQFIVENKP